ncbi:MAG TPA: hypothetical protein VMV15_11530 [Candidatus Binataceae bacterium]|nr:hypothetical protein [Candidatus Binataceae bacterium]
MARRIAFLALVAALLFGFWSASGMAEDPDAGAQWEQVPSDQAPAQQSPADNNHSQPQQMPPGLCANLGHAVSQLAVLRDRGYSKQHLMDSAKTADANGRVQQFLSGYIDFIYAHPDLSPDQVRAQIEGNCAKGPR